MIGPRVYQAQALYLADGRIVTPRVRALVDAVLTREPEQSTMLELLAMDAFQNRRFNDAARYFGRVLAGGIEDAPRRAFWRTALRARASLPVCLPPSLRRSTSRRQSRQRTPKAIHRRRSRAQPGGASESPGAGCGVRACPACQRTAHAIGGGAPGPGRPVAGTARRRRRDGARHDPRNR